MGCSLFSASGVVYIGVKFSVYCLLMFVVGCKVTEDLLVGSSSWYLLWKILEFFGFMRCCLDVVCSSLLMHWRCLFDGFVLLLGSAMVVTLIIILCWSDDA